MLLPARLMLTLSVHTVQRGTMSAACAHACFVCVPSLINMVHSLIKGEDVDWIHLGHDAIQQCVGSCEHSDEPSGSMKGRELLD
jgi:hypothetical protein